MKNIASSGRADYLARVCVFLIMATLIAGMIGCNSGYDPPPSQDLEIRTWYDLDDVRDNLAGNHTLMNDLNSTTPGYEELAGPTANGGEGWEPIGTSIPICSFTSLTGTFDGQGYEIYDLYINRPDEDHVGLFGIAYGYAVDGVIQNVGLVNVTVTGNNCVGALAADCHTVSNSYSTGNVTGNRYVGGLAGVSLGVANSYSTSDVTGIEDVGGLVGYIGGGVTVSNSYATGSVTGSSSVGGLVGANSGGTVINSYSSGSVSGVSRVGGLVGYTWCGTVSNSYSTGNVTGNGYVGGLVGDNGIPDVDAGEGSTVSHSYSTGNVAGNYDVGGLVGWNNDGTVSDSYSTGNVTGYLQVGGLVGDNHGTVSESFWDVQTSGQATSDGGTGKNTTEMQDIATFSGAAWNITTVALNETNPAYIWNIVSNVTYPFLSWQA